MPDISDKADVAVNIFAKPFQTSLAVLSLLDVSRSRINKIWLNYEPFGSQFDSVEPYIIYEYLQEIQAVPCNASQPEYWLARNVPDPNKMGDPQYRYGIRYQYAWENSNAPFLFVMHNDVYFFRDLLSPMLERIGNAAAIGEIGQCWNCPASKADLVQSVCGTPACSRDNYAKFRITYNQLDKLYEQAQANSVFVRSYNKNGFNKDFQEHPWPLPECRPNEWACLINLNKTRPLTQPLGPVPPYGAFGACGDMHLDIATPWFRGIHQHGLYCKHINVKDYLKHWVGTGKKSRLRYGQAENNALDILGKRFPDYIEWLKKRCPEAIPS